MRRMKRTFQLLLVLLALGSSSCSKSDRAPAAGKVRSQQNAEEQIDPLVAEILKVESLKSIEPDTQEHFEKNIGPLVDGIKKAELVVLYEGLPHQRYDQKLLARELREKKTVTIRDFPFYAETIPIDEVHAKKLTELCGDVQTFERFSGGKFCGGYHPDWCIEFKNDQDVYQVLVCLGCQEARFYGPNNEVFSDIVETAYEKLEELLNPLRKNRPKEPD